MARIVHISSEIHPFAKTGGLADVCSGLPKALRRLGHEVCVIMPKYRAIGACGRQFTDTGITVRAPVGGQPETGRLWRGELAPGIAAYFIDNAGYYQREGLYGAGGKDHPDNAARFIFFNRALLEACKQLGFQPDIVHCHDWQTGLTPLYIKSLYKDDPFFASTRVALTLHNLGFQGNFGRETFSLSGLPPALFAPDGVEFYGQFSFLKTGLLFADLLTTVSPTYSREIQTPEAGFGMDGILRAVSGKLHGVLNGVDYEDWDPASDPRLERPYTAADPSGKAACRAAIMRSLNLAEDAAPLAAMITRLSWQKGLDLVTANMEAMLRRNLRFIILGTGEAKYEDYFRQISARFPGRCAAIIRFDEDLAHTVLAASDLLLMPSSYEPCGLTQMYALKYGSVPIVRAVGGLADSIEEFDPAAGTGAGFRFGAFNAAAFFSAVEKALTVFANPPAWKKLILNGMQKDYSWDNTAREYDQLYRRLFL